MNLLNKHKIFSDLLSVDNELKADRKTVIWPELDGSLGRNFESTQPSAKTSERGLATAEEPPREDERREDASIVPIWDPLALFAHQPVGPLPAMVTAGPSAAAPIEPLVAEVLRSIAWGGDRRRGTARLELAGRLAGASIRVDASDGRLRVELETPPGVDAADLLERLGERLRARGLEVETLSAR